MASFKKMPSGNYQATIYVGRDSKGKILKKFITRDTLKECKSEARKLEEDIENKVLNNLSLMKMDAYMDRWFNANKNTLAPTTRKAYKLYIEKHFKPFFKQIRVYQISEIFIKEYVSEKLEYLSSTTVRKHFYTLSRILRDALKGGSPCIGMKAPPNAPYKPYVPTEKEFNALIEVFREVSLEDEIITLLAGECGLRRGEIFALKTSDIFEGECKISINEAVALEEEGYKFEAKDPKSINGIRTIIVSDHLMELIKLQKKALLKLNIDNKDMYLFLQNPHSFTKKYIRIRDENNLPPIRFHDLRHYHASMLYKYNVPDHYAAERLGHDIMVLKKIYQHLGLEEMKEIDNQVKNILNKA